MTITGQSLTDLTGVTTLLCDADGTLFPSEDPAYDASAIVTQDFAAHYGLEGTFTAEELRRVGAGRNFRATARDLLTSAGGEVDATELGRWVHREKEDVTAHLQKTLATDDEVMSALADLEQRFELAIVTSSAERRVAVCCAVTGVDRFFAADALYSAEDSLPTPVSKPDPAIYLHALRSLRIPASSAVAIEDSANGTKSAVAAGIRTVGLVRFVDRSEQDRRATELLDAGAEAVFRSWPELVEALAG
jgi:HAD superfamily hydrolase (TIGR01509 family)